MYSIVTERLHVESNFVSFFKITRQDVFSRLDERYLSQYVSPFLFSHSVIGDLKPVCYYTASQAWSFGGRHMYARRSQRIHPVCSRYTFLVNIALSHNRMLLSLLSRVIKCTSQRYHFYWLWREEALCFKRFRQCNVI